MPEAWPCILGQTLPYIAGGAGSAQQAVAETQEVGGAAAPVAPQTEPIDLTKTVWPESLSDEALRCYAALCMK